ADSEYIPLNAAVLDNRIRDAKANKQFCLDHKLIERKGSYVKGKTSGTYKVADQWGDNYVEIENHLRTQYKGGKTKKTNGIPEYLTKWFAGLKIDEKGVREHASINFTRLQRINLEYLLFIFRNKEFYFLRDDYGRCHTILTNLKSSLRQFISYRGR